MLGRSGSDPKSDGEPLDKFTWGAANLIRSRPLLARQYSSGAVRMTLPVSETVGVSGIEAASLRLVNV